nr:insulin receptor [Hymenolepis microstoma]
MTKLPPNASLPNLREITGFLVIYDLTGPDGLGTLFPNLTVIRGKSLIFNFALVIRSTSLKTISLPSLRVIQRGGVRIEINHNLCYVRTVNWSYILGNQTSAAAPIRLFTNRLICPNTCQPECASPTAEPMALSAESKSKSNKQETIHCWSSSLCQSFCSPKCTNLGLACRMDDPYTCCHDECLAGCYGPGSDACVACKGARYRGTCVTHCPTGTYLYYGRRCITAEECLNMTSIIRQPLSGVMVGANAVSGTDTSVSNGSDAKTTPGIKKSDGGNSGKTDVNGTSVGTVSSSSGVNNSVNGSTPITRPYSIHQGRCVQECPAGYERDEASGECIYCGDKCRRFRCVSMLISSLKSLSKLKDCYSVNDLYIGIHEGDPSLIQEQLDEAFSGLREVEVIRIVRATALTSLNFLRHISRINPSRASPNVTVIEIRQNDNLVDLWPPPEKNGTGVQVVSEGLVYFILNRYLCPQKITDLVKTGALRLPGNRDFRTEEREIAEATNGKMGFCESNQISLELKNVCSSSAVIQWPRFFETTTGGGGQSAASTLVLIFYQVTTRNLTVYSNRMSCGEDSWKMIPSVCNSSVVEDVNGGGVAFCSKTLTSLQPATRYAVYVESKTLFSQRGAISNIVYFNTTPSNPSYPHLVRLQAMNSSCIHVKWSPPQFSNGPLAVYLLWYRMIHIDPGSYSYGDFCFMTPDWLSSSFNPSRYIGTSSLTGMYWSYAKMQQGFCSKYQCCNPTSHKDLWSIDYRDESPPVVLGNRLTRTLNDNEVGLLVVNTDNTVPHSEKAFLTNTLSHLRSFSQYVVELQACQKPADDAPFPWEENMKPNSSVEIELTQEWKAYLKRYCSEKVFKTQRTLPAVGVDNIDSSLISSIQESPDSVLVLWAEPPNPNGVILYYVLRYRRAEQLSSIDSSTATSQNMSETEETSIKTDSGSSGWSTLCVSRANWQAVALPTNVAGKTLKEKEILLRPGGTQSEIASNRSARSVSASQNFNSNFAAAPAGTLPTNVSSSILPMGQNASMGGAELLNLLPGLYELQIMAVSLAGNSSWTPPMIFEVAASPIDTIITASVICGSVLLVLLVIIIVCVTHRIRKKRLIDSEWNSPNPEYWHVYEVDDWEMQLEDIDALNFRYPLGKGNFGMVYRGLVKTLRTPAHCFYTDPSNIAAAIKTLSASSTVFDRRDFITEACYMKQFQSFHIVRLFGIVSKCTPSSAVGVAARTFRSAGAAGSSNGSGGAVVGSAGVNNSGASASAGSSGFPQTKFHFSLCQLFSGGSGRGFFRRQNRPNRQAVPVPVKKKPFALMGEETTSSTLYRNGDSSLNRSYKSNSNIGDERAVANGTCEGAEDHTARRDRLRSGRFGNTAFTRLLRRTQKDESNDVTPKPEEDSFLAPQHCSSSDSIRPFSNNGLFVVMELMENGDLASYLRKLGDSGIGFVKPIQAYLWAVQIADGMAYLERKKYVHRDLAARNCLVDVRGVVKVGDFGLCRDIYERNYYHKVGAGKLPVRWMAPESLQSAYFTSRSDVWSFGVVLWEIATMACLPYQGMSHNEVITYVLEGNTLVSGGAPINCPPLLQSLMLYCWSYRPAQRPSFLNLLYLLAPRFADADFRQSSYFYVGDTFTQQPPPYQEFEKSTADSSAPAAAAVNAEFADLPTLIKTVLGPPHCVGGSGGSNSLSEDFPQLTSTNPDTDTISTLHFYSSSPQFEEAKQEITGENSDEELNSSVGAR